MNKMFGYRKMEESQYNKFDWKAFKGSELTFRPIQAFNGKWYIESYVHSFEGSIYLHDDNNCVICNILNADIKYENLQNSMLKLKTPSAELTKEKWSHIIKTMLYVAIVAIMPNETKPVVITMFDDLAKEFLSKLEDQYSGEDVASSENGRVVKISFKTLTQFPYRSINNITFGPKKALAPQIKQQIESLPGYEIPYPVPSSEESQEIINNWYKNAIKFRNKILQHEVNETPVIEDLDSETETSISESKIFNEGISVEESNEDDLSNNEVPF
ncbi:MAG: hypothetical protein QXV17_04945 [Candidatus Micrarchaeaceae archaeon]